MLVKSTYTKHGHTNNFKSIFVDCVTVLKALISKHGMHTLINDKHTRPITINLPVLIISYCTNKC